MGGKLKFLGDKTAVANLERDGMTRQQANDYAIAGCTSPTVGRPQLQHPRGIISLPGILELALNNGVHRMTGLQLGLKTGNAADFTSFRAALGGLLPQVRHVIPHCHAIKNTDKAMFSPVHALPLPIRPAALLCGAGHRCH